MHTPVLIKEVLNFLDCRSGANYLDCTFGGGGHSREIIMRILPDGKLFAIDKDPQAVVRGRELEEEYPDNFFIWQKDFATLDKFAKEVQLPPLKGILFDLGVSSFQLLEEPGRGFSFSQDGPLDMRYDPCDFLNASWVINRFSVLELAKLFRYYGEEKKAYTIARAIVNQRKKKAFTSTKELAETVARVKGYKGKIHPATKVFLALRLFVNRELEALEKGIKYAFPLLEKGGTLCVISFHSLEDRIVKRFFKKLSAQGEAIVLTPKPVVPLKEEISFNHRARSAKLRALKKIKKS